MRITIFRPLSTRRFCGRLGAASIGALLLAGCLAAQSSGLGLDSIRIDDLREKIAHLSSDAFRGRGNGTAELERAAEYIASVFRENGLDPAGDGDGYFQEFRIDTLSLGAGDVLDLAGARTLSLTPGVDFIPVPGSIDGRVEAGMVFVGYGIRAPELGYDDLDGLDLDGRIAVALESFPNDAEPDSRFAALSSSDLTSIEAKQENVRAAGGAALILVQGRYSRSVTPVNYYTSVLQPGLPPRRSIMDLAPEEGSIPTVVVSRPASVELLPDLPALQMDIDRTLESRPVDIPGAAILQVGFDRESHIARNVIARIEGSDPDLRDEVIVVGAHYDHDGEDNGLIWNGADDNASGTSGLLELAEAFGNGPRPGRSILLAAWAGEEKGMLGSRHYARTPPVPLDRTVAMFQLDMIGRNEEHGADPSEGFLEERGPDNANAMNVIGSVFSRDMRDAVMRANETVGLDLRFRYDYRAQDLIRRSDHWTFLSRGVPALFFFGGLHPDYHTPRDTADKINYEKVENVVKLAYLALMELGNRESRPAFQTPPAAP